MFRVRKSIKHFREDPAWAYRKRAPDYLASFEQDGYPFSLGPRGNFIRHLFQGTVQDRPTSLFHHSARRLGGGSPGRTQSWDDYSVAVVTLPRALPATAFTSGTFIHETEKWKRRAIPVSAGTYQDRPGGGPMDAVRRQSVDPDFAVLIDTKQVHQLTRRAHLGWRIDGDRIIGWTRGRKPFDEIQGMADTLIAIVGAFPEQAWHWPETTGG
ncbi:hypothetical protein [Streptomyces noursei]|uniref:hypothetical protein n=1 Tax=Streptomyces noursei TaxID=1971 RepID=UPI001677076F|nr:hypothetical protein [Streptomyces noursei]MCZ1019786.1 hypothetical protein [Streptomyces noursei]GGX36637.1 hypothetical protein GCM10010341_67820 [Streptomyces noursei]